MRRRLRNRIDMMQFRIQHRVDFILLHTIKMKNNRYSEWDEEGVKRSPIHTYTHTTKGPLSNAFIVKPPQNFANALFIVYTVTPCTNNNTQPFTHVVRWWGWFTGVIHILNDKLLCGSRTLVRPWINIENWWLMYVWWGRRVAYMYALYIVFIRTTASYTHKNRL